MAALTGTNACEALALQADIQCRTVKGTGWNASLRQLCSQQKIAISVEIVGESGSNQAAQYQFQQSGKGDVWGEKRFTQPNTPHLNQ
jgi:hypothetical protein